MILAFVRYPSLTGHTELDLTKVDFEDLGSKVRDEMFGKSAVFSFKRTWQLRWISKPVAITV